MFLLHANENFDRPGAPGAVLQLTDHSRGGREFVSGITRLVSIISDGRIRTRSWLSTLSNSTNLRDAR